MMIFRADMWSSQFARRVTSKAVDVHKRFASCRCPEHVILMARFKQIYIHLGAHRTGTSSFQMCLHENRAQIGSAGYDVAYPGRDDIPSGDLALRLPGPRHGLTQQRKFATRVARKIERHSPDPLRPLILSEENIPGRMIHFFHGQFYPAADARLGALKMGVGRVEIAGALLVIRPYSDLFMSAFRKRAEDQIVDPWSEVIPHLMQMDRGWPDLVRVILDILKPGCLNVVDYSARGPSGGLLQSLVPDFANMSLVEPSHRVNLSASDAALCHLQQRYTAGEKLERSAWQEVVADFADREAEEFTPLNTAQAAALKKRYLRDLDTISRLEDVILTR